MCKGEEGRKGVVRQIEEREMDSVVVPPVNTVSYLRLHRAFLFSTSYYVASHTYASYWYTFCRIGKGVAGEHTRILYFGTVDITN